MKVIYVFEYAKASFYYVRYHFQLVALKEFWSTLICHANIKITGLDWFHY